jgi:uncharacterized protein
VTTYLLDVNVLIALAWPQHVHHKAAHRWFAGTGRYSWATCAVTQLAFVRISSNPAIIAEAVAPAQACKVLRAITELTGHRYWLEAVAPDQIDELQSLAIVGHRQVTDAYLMGLARHHAGCLATFDRGLKELAGSIKGSRPQVELLDSR